MGDAEEAVEEIGEEVLEGDSREEDEEEIKKENFSKNPSHNNNNNNNNVKKVFNRESAKRKVSIPLHNHMKSMEQHVVEPLPVMEQIEIEDDASRKSSVASTQWSWPPSDNEERPPIPLKTASAPTVGRSVSDGGLSVEPVRSVRVSTVVPARVDDPNAEKRGKF